MSSERSFPVLGLAALACGVTGYVLLFYVRSALLSWVGVLLMLFALPLAIATIARSRQRLTTALGVLAIVPFAILVWAVWSWLET